MNVRGRSLQSGLPVLNLHKGTETASNTDPQSVVWTNKYMLVFLSVEKKV